RLQGVAVLQLQRVAVLVGQLRPAPLWRNGTGLTQELHALLVHLEEQQVGELLDVVAVADALVAQDVGVVPDFGDELFVGHAVSLGATLLASLRILSIISVCERGSTSPRSISLLRSRASAMASSSESSSALRSGSSRLSHSAMASAARSLGSSCRAELAILLYFIRLTSGVKAEIPSC